MFSKKEVNTSDGAHDRSVFIRVIHTKRIEFITCLYGFGESFSWASNSVGVTVVGGPMDVW